MDDGEITALYTSNTPNTPSRGGKGMKIPSTHATVFHQEQHREYTGWFKTPTLSFVKVLGSK
jgi:hypothetical protein